jgi:hypothetical protein
MPPIQMGNDEFILYIRKRRLGQGRTTAELGRRIWEWLRIRGGRKVVDHEPCRWGDTPPAVAADDLPKTATQFEFDRALLPDLYSYLDTL